MTSLTSADRVDSALLREVRRLRADNHDLATALDLATNPLLADDQETEACRRDSRVWWQMCKRQHSAIQALHAKIAQLQDQAKERRHG